MAKDTTITQENFDALLDWLDLNREAAGQKYEKIRQRLIRIFACRGCFEAEELADTTINRVVDKMPQIIEKYIGEPALYFYGVADKIHLEWQRKQKKRAHLELLDSDGGYEISEIDSDIEYECLESCLQTLPAAERELIVDYYREEKTAKIQFRRSLASALGVPLGTLHVKASRIRANLQKCVQKCVAAKTDV